MALTFTTGCANGYSVPWPEELCLGDGVVDLCLKDIEEAVLAYLLTCLWSLEDGPSLFAKRTVSRGHDCSRSKGSVRFRSRRRHKDNCGWASLPLGFEYFRSLTTTGPATPLIVSLSFYSHA